MARTGAVLLDLDGLGEVLVTSARAGCQIMAGLAAGRIGAMLLPAALGLKWILGRSGRFACATLAKYQDPPGLGPIVGGVLVGARAFA